MDAERLQKSLEALHADLRHIFGDRLHSLVLYGWHVAGTAGRSTAARPIHTMAFVESLTADDLDACASFSASWTKRGLATPLLLTAAEFETSLDAFPIEYGDIIDRHRLVAGANPFERLSVKPEDLRRACELQAKSHLLHLREGYIEAAGRPQAVVRLIAASAPSLRAILVSVARLQDVPAEPDEVLAAEVAAGLGVPFEPIHRVLALENAHPLSGSEAMQLYPVYLEVVDRLARFLDGWRRTGGRPTPAPANR